MKLEARLVASPSVTSAAVGEEAVLLDAHAGHYFSLNEVGARAWALIAGGKTLGECARLLSEEFEATPATVEEDVLELAGRLLDAGLVGVQTG